jgi:hypothetical protein
MAHNSEIQRRKEADIKAEFKRLMEVERLRYDDAVTQVAHKFYLTPSTAQRIFWGEYDKKRARAAKASPALSPAPCASAA